MSRKSRESSTFLLVDSYQHTIANRSHVKYEFTNTKKLLKKLARIEASSICRQQFANLFADCFTAVHTHQLEFANTSLPTLVCRVKPLKVFGKWCRKSCDYIIRPIYAFRYDCLVDRKGRAAYLSSLVTVANQETLYDFLSFVQVNLESVVIELGTCEAEYIRSKFYRE